MNEKNLPDDINSKTLDELTQEAQKLINKLEKDENLQNSISSYQELVKLNKIIEKKKAILHQMGTKETLKELLYQEVLQKNKRN